MQLNLCLGKRSGSGVRLIDKSKKETTFCLKNRYKWI